MLKFKTLKLLPFLFAVIFLSNVAASAQTTTATLTGSVTDEKEAVVPGATVKVINTEIGFERTATTNDNGTFTVALLPPATYRVTVERGGFAPFEVTDVVLNGNDQRALNIRLKVGGISDTVIVTAEAPLIDQNPAVGTTIDRNLINNLPLNGRSLQTLINLSPGVVSVPVSQFGSGNQGQFSVNGQRPNSNYFTVDGVSGNFSASNFQGLGQNGSGSLPSTSITGGFTNLASVDALQEFTIQTSTTSAQFGRSPGAQVAFTTRSGTNDFHGSLFEYVRNDIFDARDFFDLTKPPLRYNDFGGTIGGPVILPHFGEGGPALWKGTDKTFFFFSYEGQRFVQPQTPIVNLAVPSLATRRSAANPIAAAILNAYPLPNGADITDTTGALTGGAYYSASYSNPTTSDAWSLRVDHRFSKNVTLFVRGNTSPSDGRSINTSNPSTYNSNTQETQMLTAGSTQVFSSKLVNEFTANYSRQKADSIYGFDGFGGGSKPDSSLFFPGSADVRYYIIGGIPDVFEYSLLGPTSNNRNKQLQFIDNLSYTRGAHQLKFGADYRRLLPTVGQGGTIPSFAYDSLQQLNDNQLSYFYAFDASSYTAKFTTYSFYGQDTWKASKRLTLDYGLRWEIAPSPTTANGAAPLTLAAPPDLSKLDQSNLALAPLGTPYYKTEYTKFAPRFGISYLVNDKAGRELVLRGGIGTYYDLGQTGFGDPGFPYSRSLFTSGGSLPLSSADLSFPPFDFTPGPDNLASVTVAASDYTLPRTYQFNITAEQSLGINQTISVAYVGALGRKLVRARSISFAQSATQVPGAFFSPNFSSVNYVDNGTESSYHSLQAQFTRRLSRGFQALVSYTWSHSIDDSSNDTAVFAPGAVFPQSVYRGSSDFDVRHNLSGALSYRLPAPKFNKFADAILGGWSLDSIFSARTGLPYNVMINEANPFNIFVAYRRADLTGAPLYLDDPAVPTGRRLNPAAFNFAVPVGRMGTLGRNSLRGPGFWQIDLALRRNIALTEKVSLQLRAEAFNVFNHANFLYPTNTAGRSNNTVASNFGIIARSASRAYGGGGTFGGFNPLFQNGGPRSMQFSARISF